jgi:hypothetical protein
VRGNHVTDCESHSYVNFFLDKGEGAAVTCTRTENVHLHVTAFVEVGAESSVNSRVGNR